MKTKNEYSMIVTGSLNKVKGIIKKHGVELRPADFFPGKGYVFSVEEEGIGFSPLVKELGKSIHVSGLRFSFSSESV